MARINVYRYPTEQELYNGAGETTLTGWFNPDSAAAYREADDWDGSNEISVNTDSQWDHQTLYRAKSGRWVLNNWSQRQGVAERYEFIDDDAAKTWLLHNQHDAAVEEWFGQLDEEAGPNMGRPGVGPKWEVRLDKETRAQVEALVGGGRKRADVLRDLIVAGLASTESA
ncbi:hypothetical protein AB0L71_28300 [Streptomyces sp. NPDC052052]|uniref:hypothetical protein n=1 Tax=Streptomyces sp. NPDC052052 TaxID=3154756 RepID=UPI0034354576